MPDRIRDPDQTRRRILAAAARAFADAGYAGARVDAIARAAGVNKRMLYHYFGDKASLYAAVLRAPLPADAATAAASPDGAGQDASDASGTAGAASLESLESLVRRFAADLDVERGRLMLRHLLDADDRQRVPDGAAQPPGPAAAWNDLARQISAMQAAGALKAVVDAEQLARWLHVGLLLEQLAPADVPARHDLAALVGVLLDQPAPRVPGHAVRPRVRLKPALTRRQE